jgi:hypothetical protein
MFFASNFNMWYISTQKHNTSAAPVVICTTSSTEVPTEGWTGGVTVTKVEGGGSEGNEPDTPDVETSYLLVQGFSASNFGGDGTSNDPNGKYYLQDETATGNDRVWVSESGYFKIYDSSKQGSWYLDGVNTDLGNSVYPYGERASDGSPYKEDGSSCEWWSMGSLINGASVTLVSGADSGGNGDSGEGEGGDDTSTSYLRVSGFSASNFGGAGTTQDPNGTYKLSNPEATGNDRVWIKDNYFKIYDPYKNGGWFLDNVDGTLGRVSLSRCDGRCFCTI